MVKKKKTKTRRSATRMVCETDGYPCSADYLKKIEKKNSDKI